LQKGIQPGIAHVFKTAKENGMTTSLDLQWDPENKWNFPYKDCLPYVDIFLPNLAEILLLSGEDDLTNALEKIGQYTHTIIVKRGTDGAVAYEKGNIVESKPFLHEHFVDAIGAGDSFNAGFISSFLDGRSLVESLELANLAGAVNTMSSGGTSAFKTRHGFDKKVKEIFNIVL
jgi:sugar/nucleoside kinase (ribokinase family)